MIDIADMLRQGATNWWVFVPTAMLLGGLHGLEPGHSKTMMAAFIVAVRGTIGQAVLLGVSAAISHTALVWAVAFAGLYFGKEWASEANEPYFQLASAAIVIAIALWMLARTYRDQQAAKAFAVPNQHIDEIKRINTGHEMALLEVFEAGVPPRFRLRFDHHGKAISPYLSEAVSIETTRPDGSKQLFTFTERDGYLESNEMIPEPHAFSANLRLAHGSHTHDYNIEFTEHDHGHSHEGLIVGDAGFEDAHERAHASDIKRRFADRHVTTGQIIMFGLTGGLIPCPAAITVLLLCLQLKQITLGVTLVVCFSIGLALTMVLSGVIAAWSVRHAATRWSGFDSFMRKAPYVSSALILCIGFFLAAQAWTHLPA